MITREKLSVGACPGEDHQEERRAAWLPDLPFTNLKSSAEIALHFWTCKALLQAKSLMGSKSL